MKILSSLKLVALLLCLFVSACQTKQENLYTTLSSKLGSNFKKDSDMLILVYNFHTSCLGCNATIEETFSSDRLTSKFNKNNICILSKEVREVETKGLQNDLNELGIQFPIIYNSSLYEAALKKFSNYSETGGLIHVDSKEKILFASSFKNPEFFNIVMK